MTCLANYTILLANSNRWYFNNLVKKPCHKTHCRCPHRLNLSFQLSRSCAEPNIKVLKDKGLEFADSILPFVRQRRKGKERRGDVYHLVHCWSKAKRCNARNNAESIVQLWSL